MIIGFFGGSFDPIHFGHLNLGIELKEKAGLDEVWFCPSSLNPLKSGQKAIASAENRLKMVQLAIEGIPGFKVIENEIFKEGPSYTVDALRELINQEKSHQFRLILGDDALANFLKWKDPSAILSMAPPLVGTRVLTDVEIASSQDPLLKILKDGYVPISRFEISSTDIRKRLKQGLYCGHLVPKKALDFIKANHLYL